MDKIIEVIKKFKNLVVVLFFLLGSLLILLGVTKDLNLPTLNQLTPDANFRWTCLVLGILCLIVSLFILYRPPYESDGTISKPDNIRGPVPEEFTMSYSRRRALLSINQEKILTHLVHAGSGGKFIPQEDIEKVFGQYGSGLLYRLEHLRLLGFLTRHKLGQDVEGNNRFAYALSSDFIKEVGDLDQLSLVGPQKSFGKPMTYGSQNPGDKGNNATGSKRDKKKK